MEISKQMKMIILGCGAVVILIVGYLIVRSLNKEQPGDKSSGGSLTATGTLTAYPPSNVFDDQQLATQQQPVTQQQQTSLQTSLQTTPVANIKPTVPVLQLKPSAFINDPDNDTFNQFRNSTIEPVKEFIGITQGLSDAQKDIIKNHMDDLIDIVVLDLYNDSTNRTSIDNAKGDQNKISDVIKNHYKQKKLSETDMLELSNVKLTGLPIEALKFFDSLIYIGVSDTGIMDGQIEKLSFMKTLALIIANGNKLTMKPDTTVGFEHLIGLCWL